MKYFGSLSEQSAIWPLKDIFLRASISDMLIVKRGSVPQIVCFPYIPFVTSSTLNNVNYIFCFRRHVFIYFDLFLNFTDEPSQIYLHKPHLGPLHFFTLHSSVCLIENLAFVNNRFKFGGCLLLLRNVLFLKHWSSSFLCRMDLSCIMSVYISGFWGLNVVTYGMIFVPSVIYFEFKSFDLSRDVAFWNASSIRLSGYFRLIKNSSNSSNRLRSVLSSDTIVFSLLAKV